MMVGAVLLVVFLAAVQGNPAQQHGQPREQEIVMSRDFMLGLEDLKWNQFKVEFGREYVAEEEKRRKAIFVDNLKEIAIHNALYRKGLSSFEQGLNQFADLEPWEYRKLTNCLLPVNSTRESHRVGDQSAINPPRLWLPQEVDWRKKGYVTGVKNQEACGSCWAFGATGAVEGQHFKKTGRLTSLSEQNLVDCSSPWGNKGCDGGLTILAFQYIEENGGIDTEASYPYMAKEGPCRFKTSQIGAKITGYAILPWAREDVLKRVVASVGPVSVSIDASPSDFQRYKSGVYDNPKCGMEGTNHAVLVVGYGTDSRSGKDYWLVKNSWGTQWGDSGYIKMSRNKRNQCLIASRASYPTV